MSNSNELLIGLVSISDRASQGVYKDEGLPALEDWFGRALASPWRTEKRLIPDEQPVIETTLRQLVDDVGCHLVLTTGGTGLTGRDVTIEAVRPLFEKSLKSDRLFERIVAVRCLLGLGDDASLAAMLALELLFPVPPRKEWTETILVTFGPPVCDDVAQAAGTGKI